MSERDRNGIWWKTLLGSIAIAAVIALVVYIDAHAATVPSYTVSLYKGTSKVSCSPYPGKCSGSTRDDAWMACGNAASELQKTTTSPVTCKTPVLGLVTVADPPPLVATLTWTAPTQNTDGSVLTDLAGFTLRYGLCTNLDKSVTLPPNLSTYSPPNLTPGTWCFTLDAVNAAGAHSDQAGPVSKTL